MHRYNIQNPYKTTYRTLILLSFGLNIFAVAGILTALEEIAVYVGMLQLFLFFLGLIFLFTGRSEVKKIVAMINGKDLWAHWNYTPGLWDSNIKTEYRLQRQNGIITAVVLLIAGPVVGIYKDPEHWYISGAILGSILGGVVLTVAFMHARSFLKRSMASLPEIFIAAHGVFFNGIYIEWSSLSTRLTSAAIIESNLHLKYVQRGRYGIQKKDLSIPIPPDKKEEAARVAERLTAAITS